MYGNPHNPCSPQYFPSSFNDTPICQGCMDRSCGSQFTIAMLNRLSEYERRKEEIEKMGEIEKIITGRKRKRREDEEQEIAEEQEKKRQRTEQIVRILSY